MCDFLVHEKEHEKKNRNEVNKKRKQNGKSATTTLFWGVHFNQIQFLIHSNINQRNTC